MHYFWREPEGDEVIERLVRNGDDLVVPSRRRVIGEGEGESESERKRVRERGREREREREGERAGVCVCEREREREMGGREQTTNVHLSGDSVTATAASTYRVRSITINASLALVREQRRAQLGRRPLCLA